MIKVVYWLNFIVFWNLGAYIAIRKKDNCSELMISTIEDVTMSTAAVLLLNNYLWNR